MMPNTAGYAGATLLATLCMGCAGEVLVEGEDLGRISVENNRTWSLVRAEFLADRVDGCAEMARSESCVAYLCDDANGRYGTGVFAGKMTLRGGQVDVDLEPEPTPDGTFHYFAESPELPFSLPGDVVEVSVEGSESVRPFELTLPSPQKLQVDVPSGPVQRTQSYALSWLPGTEGLVEVLLQHYPEPTDPIEDENGTLWSWGPVTERVLCRFDSAAEGGTIPPALLATLSPTEPFGDDLRTYGELSVNTVSETSVQVDGWRVEARIVTRATDASGQDIRARVTDIE